MTLRVGLLLNVGTGYDRDVLSGIGDFARQHQWRLFPFGHRLVQSPQLLRRQVRRWRGDGLIASIGSTVEAEMVRRLGRPTVAIGHGKEVSVGSRVRTDVEATGELACRHLRETGCGHFAFVGLSDIQGSEFRRLAFEHAVVRAGADVVPALTVQATHDQLKVFTAMVRWLRALPVPVGVFALADAMGSLLIEAANEAGRRVPEDVAILGAGNDEVVCQFVHPTLSSLDVNADGLGYAAAEMLQRKLDEGGRDQGIVDVAPIGVVARGSTGRRGVEDALAMAALQAIERSACEGCTIDDVAKELEAPRSTLEQRFRSAVGHSLGEAIRRTRIAHARELLRETELPLAEIGYRCGFQYASGFSRAFREHEGLSPTAYRSRYRRRGPGSPR